jgi:predicted nucleic acid-binding protein
MRKVVSNTTPLISSLKIGHLHLLESLYSKVIIPQAVWQEIEQGREWFYYIDLQTLPFIDIQSINNADAVNYLTDLDRGEAEVIVLAREIEADLVIIDEEIGRSYARHFGLALTGTLGILLKAKQNGLVPEVRPLLEVLVSKGVWIDRHLLDHVLTLAGEKNNKA